MIFDLVMLFKSKFRVVLCDKETDYSHASWAICRKCKMKRYNEELQKLSWGIRLTGIMTHCAPSLPTIPKAWIDYVVIDGTECVRKPYACTV